MLPNSCRREEAGGVVGVVEDDRTWSGRWARRATRWWVGFLAGVDGEGGELLFGGLIL